MCNVKLKLRPRILETFHSFISCLRQQLFLSTILMLLVLWPHCPSTLSLPVLIHLFPEADVISHFPMQR